jgi:DME family drug/metabolite transporter
MTASSGRLLILVAAVLWGTTGTTQALAPAGAEPLSVAAVRVSVGGTALLAVAAARGLLPMRALPGRPILLAAASLVVAQLCFFAAVKLTGVAVGTVVSIGSSPIAVGALEWAFGGRRPSRRWVLATALGIAGCVLLVGAARNVMDVLLGLPMPVEGVPDALGVGLALVVGLGYAGYILGSKRLVGECRPEVATSAVFGLAALAMIPVLAIVGFGWALQPKGLLVSAHLGLVTVALAYSLFARGLVVVSGATAVSLTLAEPLTAGVLGVLLLGELLSAAAQIGILLVLAALTILSVGAESGDPTPDRESATKER